MKNTTILLAVAITMVYSCKKEYKDIPPQLEIHVVNSNEAIQRTANVTLYLSFEDWRDNINSVAFDTTDYLGMVTFKDLEPTIYYFMAEKDSLDNKYGISTTQKKLVENTVAVIKTVIE